jgi:hypothetical protein
MNKVVLGMLVGGVLGIFDGLTAWFTPEARSQMVGIVTGSTIKGLVWTRRRSAAGVWSSCYPTRTKPLLLRNHAARWNRGHVNRLRHATLRATRSAVRNEVQRALEDSGEEGAGLSSSSPCIRPNFFSL